MKVNLYEAKSQLSALVERAARGEAIVIAKNGKPVARLMPLPPRKKRKLGQLAGVISVTADFDDPVDLELFEQGHPRDPLRRRTRAR